MLSTPGGHYFKIRQQANYYLSDSLALSFDQEHAMEVKYSNGEHWLIRTKTLKR